LQLSDNADELVEFEVGGHRATVTIYSVVLRYLDPQGRATAEGCSTTRTIAASTTCIDATGQEDGNSRPKSFTAARRMRRFKKPVTLSRTALRR
jgi:hypothetical protein